MSEGPPPTKVGAPANEDSYDPYGFYQKVRQNMNAEPRRVASPFPNSSPFNPSSLAVGPQQNAPSDHEDADPRLHVGASKSSRPNFRANMVKGSRPFELDEEEDNSQSYAHRNQDEGRMEFDRNHPDSRQHMNNTPNAHEHEQVTERRGGHEKAGHMAWNKNHPSSRRRSEDYHQDDEHGRMEARDEDAEMADNGPRETFDNHQQHREGDNGAEPESPPLFVSQNDDRPSAAKGARASNAIEKRAEPVRRFSYDAQPRMNDSYRHPARRPSPPPFESNVGNNRRASRYSGQKTDNWHVNKLREPVDPRSTLELPGRAPINLHKEYHMRTHQYGDGYYDMYPGDDHMEDDYNRYGPRTDYDDRHPRGHSRGIDRRYSDDRSRSPAPVHSLAQQQSRVQKVSKASLRKRGLKEGQEEEVLQRGYGVNDPENVEIVNMKESGEYSFEDIAKILNDKRLEEGRDPKLTTTGVNGRYNRTAPTLFESQGLHFVSLIERKRNPAAANMHGRPVGDVAGEPQDLWIANTHDRMLVEAVREYNSEKWSIVANKVHEKSGFRFPENQLAKRFVLL